MTFLATGLSLRKRNMRATPIIDRVLGLLPRVLFDLLDTTSLYQDSAGTTPVTQHGDPVGLVLDKSQMGGKTAAQFIADQPNLMDTVDAFPHTLSGPGDSIVSQSNLTAGATYLIEYEVTASTFTGDLFSPPVSGGLPYIVFDKTVGIHQIVVEAEDADVINFALGGSGSPTGDVTLASISVKEIPGNHILNESFSQRPLFRAESLLGVDVTLNGDFDDWALSNVPDNWSNDGASDDANNYFEQHASGLRIVSDGTFKALEQSCLEIGKRYEVTVSVPLITSGGVAVSITNNDTFNTLEAGVFTFVGTAERSDLVVKRRGGLGAVDAVVEYVTVREIEELNETEFVTNRNFVSDVSGWTAGAATITHENGKLRVTNDGTGTGNAAQLLTGLTIGKTYRVFVNVTDGTAAQQHVSINSSHDPFYSGTDLVAGGIGFDNFTFIATAENMYIVMGNRGGNTAGLYTDFDNVSVREILPLVTTDGELVFDGLDDKLEAALNGFTDECTIAFDFVYQGGTGSFDWPISLNNGATSEEFGAFILNNRSGISFKTTSGGSNHTIVTGVGTVNVGDRFTFVAVLNSSEILVDVYKNNSFIQTVSSSTAVGVPTITQLQLATAANGNKVRGNFGRTAAFASYLDETQRALVAQWMLEA